VINTGAGWVESKSPTERNKWIRQRSSPP
jgi:hypothetical protein